MFCNNCGRPLADGEVCTCQMYSDNNNTQNSAALTIIKESFVSPIAMTIAILISINLIFGIIQSGLIANVLQILSCIAVWMNYTYGKTGNAANPGRGMTLYSGILITNIVLISISFGALSLLSLFGLLGANRISIEFGSLTLGISIVLAITLVICIVCLILYLFFYVNLRRSVVSIRDIIWGKTDRPVIPQSIIVIFFILAGISVLSFIFSSILITDFVNGLIEAFPKLSSDTVNDFESNYSSSITIWGFVSTGISIAMNILYALYFMDLKKKFSEMNFGYRR